MLYSRLLGVWSWLWMLAFMLTQISPTKTTTATRNAANCSNRLSVGGNKKIPGTSHSCILLNLDIVPKLCREKPTKLDEVWTPHCGRRITTCLPPPAPVRSVEGCEEELRELLRLDNAAKIEHQRFTGILHRFDCAQSYSMAYQCKHCGEIYKAWTCSSMISYWTRGRNVKPCRSYCHRVEQRCPYFLPLDNPSPVNYAGEPTFLCLDPYIGETEEQQKNSMYGSNCCYEECETEPGGICLRGCKDLDKQLDNDDEENRRSTNVKSTKNSQISSSSSSIRLKYFKYNTVFLICFALSFFYNINRTRLKLII